MTEKQLRAKVVATAVAWLGCKEADGSHRKIIDVYNAARPLPRGYAVKYTDAWCATYVSAVAIKADVADILPRECGCGQQIALFKRLGRWQENDAHVPEPGDVIFYDWDDRGAGDCTGAPEHVGIVTAVSGSKMTIIEGNKGNTVAYRTMQVNGKYIRGYGLPDYDGKAAKSGGAGGSGTATTATSHTVVAGDTLGKIAARYGTTVANLAAINGISNTNLIRVGQVVHLTEAAAATAKLAELGVINSPGYWADAVASGKVKYLDALLIKAAEVITKAGDRTATPEEGVAALVAAGIINTPAYWLANYAAFPSLGLLLCALGGAVK